MENSTVSFDLDSPEIMFLCERDKELAKVIEMVGPIQYDRPGAVDEFCFLIHEIIEQMLSVKVGAIIYDRVVDLCGGHLCPEEVSKLTVEEIRATGTSSSKALCVKILAESVLCGDLVLAELKELSDEEVLKRLTSIRGIGPWTAKMYLMFVLDRQSIIPFEDGAFLQSFRWMYNTKDSSPKVVQKKCKEWQPYATLASRYLYRALDLGFTKKPFYLFE